MTLQGATGAPPQAHRSLMERVLTRARSGARKVAEALATPLLPEDFLDLIDPLRSGADLRGRVVRVSPETASATTVEIRPGRGWRTHRPGQYTRIGVDVGGVRHWRAYSITSPVTDADTITLTIRAIAEGKVSNYVKAHLRPGDVIMLDQATGGFVLPTPVPDSALFLTAGSGITPVMGMLRNVGLPRDVVVLHSAPTPEEMLFRTELRSLADSGRIRLITRFTRAAGVLSVTELDTVVPDWRTRHTWACGPTALLDDAEAHWADAGLAARLHTERFRPRIHAVGEGGQVTFTRSAITAAAAASTTLLDAGEEAGVLMPSGCRMGICFNCVVHLTDGSVRDLRTGDLTTANPDDPVVIQTCVSAAAGPCHLRV